jgi:hypothetical protein
MCNKEEIRCRLISLAESVWGEITFDLDFKIDPVEFFSLKFKNDDLKTKKLSCDIYKYFKNG